MLLKPIGMLKAASGASITAPNYQAIGTMVNGAGAVSPAWGTHATNDVGLLVYSCRGDQGPISTPSGWTSIVNDASTWSRLQVFWRRAASASEGSVSLDDSGALNMAVIASYRGCPTGSAPVAALVTGNATASTAVSITGSTSTQANSLIMSVLTTEADVAGDDMSAGFANGDLTSLTRRFGESITTGSGTGIYFSDGLKATAGAFGATTATMTTSAGQAFAQIEIYGV